MKGSKCPKHAALPTFSYRICILFAISEKNYIYLYKRRIPRIILRTLEYIPQIYSPLYLLPFMVSPSWAFSNLLKSKKKGRNKYGKTNSNHNHSVKVGVDRNVGAVLWKKPDRLDFFIGGHHFQSFLLWLPQLQTSIEVMLTCLVAGEVNIWLKHIVHLLVLPHLHSDEDVWMRLNCWNKSTASRWCDISTCHIAKWS